MVSIVIPTYNRSRLLDRCLDAILSMDGVDAAEIVVVDDGSPDDTPEVVARHAARHPGLRHIRQANAGPGEARNRGVAEARGEYILFLDDDVFPLHGLLAAHVALLDAGADVSQGRLDWHPDLADTPVIRFMDRRRMQFVQDFAQGQAIDSRYIYTGNVCLRKGLFERTGGFDPRFGRRPYAAFEDTALAERLEEAGARMASNPAARAIHYHPLDVPGLQSREYKSGYNSRVLTDHYPRLADRVGLPRITRLARLQTALLGTFLALGLDRFVGFDLGLRLRCRRAFVKGWLEAGGETR